MKVGRAGGGRAAEICEGSGDSAEVTVHRMLG